MSEISDEQINVKIPPEIDPVVEARNYVDRMWFQQMMMIRTNCYHCHKDSPVIHVQYPQMRRREYQLADIFRDLQMEFAKLGWKFQLRRSYCPSCKGLGSA